MLVFSLSTSKITWRWSSANSSWRAQFFFSASSYLNRPWSYDQ